MGERKFTSDYCKWAKKKGYRLNERKAAEIFALAQNGIPTLPNSQSVKSVVKEIDCIGDIHAPRIIAEIGDVRKFKNKHSLIAYAGIDAPSYQSGAFHASKRHISKRGNSYLRKTGYEIMQSLIKHKPADNAVYDFIQKKRSEGKCGKEAMIAGLNNSFWFTTARLWSFTPNIDCSLKYIIIRRLNTSFKRQLCYIIFFLCFFSQLCSFCLLIFLSRFLF